MPEVGSVEWVKTQTLVAMFSDDTLMETLVLKGGNALALVLKLDARASVDLDFSMAGDWPHGLADFTGRVERVIRTTFLPYELVAFDIHVAEQPGKITPDLRDFWGGYSVGFKLLRKHDHDKLAGDIEAMRRNAIRVGQSTKIEIDISRHEYIDGKEAQFIDDHQIFVYSPQMIVCEKLRAICQQMPAYNPVVKRGRPGGARARDFFDIYNVMTSAGIDPRSADFQGTLLAMFDAKRVPLTLLQEIQAQKAVHAPDFVSVIQTVKTGITLQPFAFYFDFVVQLVDQLELARHEDAP